jgi:hypothetical protein
MHRGWRTARPEQAVTRTVIAPAAVRPRPARRRPTALLLATLLCAGLAAPAATGAEPDWNRLDDPLEGGLGLHAGRIGGTGLAFKWPLWWWLQLQAAGGIWNTDGNKRHNVGIEVQYLLRQDPRLRLYLLTGYGYYSHRERGSDADGREIWDTDTSWNTGFGVGIERLMGQRWSLKADLSFTYRDDEQTTTIWPQVGFFYYW